MCMFNRWAQTSLVTKAHQVVSLDDLKQTNMVKGWQSPRWGDWNAANVVHRMMFSFPHIHNDHFIPATFLLSKI